MDDYGGQCSICRGQELSEPDVHLSIRYQNFDYDKNYAALQESLHGPPEKKRNKKQDSSSAPLPPIAPNSQVYSYRESPAMSLASPSLAAGAFEGAQYYSDPDSLIEGDEMGQRRINARLFERVSLLEETILRMQRTIDAITRVEYILWQYSLQSHHI